MLSSRMISATSKLVLKKYPALACLSSESSPYTRNECYLSTKSSSSSSSSSKNKKLSKSNSSSSSSSSSSMKRNLSTVVAEAFSNPEDDYFDSDESISKTSSESSKKKEEEEARNIIESLQKTPSSLPSVVYLYDETGSNLFEDITKTEDYYLTRTEREIIREYATEMVRFPDDLSSAKDEKEDVSDMAFIELGAGSGKKTRPILDAMMKINQQSKEESATPKCTYIPADYSSSALEENMNMYNHTHRSMIQPFVGTHDDALEMTSSNLSASTTRKTFAYFGSSLGNEADPVPFLSKIASCCNPRDRLLIGVDMAASDHKPIERIERAYNDSEGVTERFILNSLEVVNRIAGLDFNIDDFRLVAEYDTGKDAVNLYAECINHCCISHTSSGSSGKKYPMKEMQIGERIFIEQSGKFTPEKIEEIATRSGFILSQRQWTDPSQYYTIYELIPDILAPTKALSDFVFDHLITPSKMSDQPLQLRNPFAFYRGHIAAFTDRISGVKIPHRHLERESYRRGVDPDVDDPEKCHDHSPRVQVWPDAQEFQRYEGEVGDELKDKISKEGVTREVLLSLEHAEMHFETLMYMILQHRQTMERKVLEEEDQKVISSYFQFAPSPTSPPSPTSTSSSQMDDKMGQTVPIQGANVRMGLTPKQRSALGFAWDNEYTSKTTKTHVDPFECSILPVTNSEFMNFVQDGGYRHQEFWTDNDIHRNVTRHGGNGAWSWITQENIRHPLFWQLQEKEEGVKTLDQGIVPFTKSGMWPVNISLFEAAAYCRWMGQGARIMTESEYHALFHSPNQEEPEVAYTQTSRLGNNNWRYRGLVPVGHMNDANVNGIYDLVGNGWEWTSTTFDGLDSTFLPMHDYQEYSSDFFDGKHYVMKGASPFTGRLGMRLSFRNWFQPNYPYPVAKFRLVY